MDLQVSCVWDMERKGNKANDVNNGPASIMRVGHGKEGDKANDANNGPASIMRVGHGKEGGQSRKDGCPMKTGLPLNTAPQR